MNVVKYDSSEQKPMIFISYAHENAEIVSRFADRLMEQGYSVWLDKLRIEAGEAYNPAIDRNLKACELVLVFLSRRYVEKQYCTLEFNIAADNRKTIVTVCLDDVNRELNPNAAYMFNQYSGLNILQCGCGVRNETDFEDVCRQLCDSSLFQWTRLSEAERKHKRIMLTTTAALVDRLEFHRKTVYKTSGNYHLDEIHRELFPGLQAEDLRVVYFDENRNELPLYRCMRDHPHQHFLLVGDGGIGKTVSMMSVGAYLHSHWIPAVYIPLRAINLRKDSLREYIRRVVCGNVQGYWNELQKHYQTPFDKRPNLVLLLDGMNEIPPEQMRELIRGELISEILRDWPGVQVIMSCRYDFRAQYNELESVTQALFMQQLEVSQVERYLDKCGLESVQDPDLLRLLGNPLLLSLYANAEAYRTRYNQIQGIELEANPDNAGKIIGNFLKTQLYRAFHGTYTSLAEHMLVLEYILPAIAYKMVCDQRFSISSGEVNELLYDLEDDVRRKWYERDRLGRLMAGLGLEEPEWKNTRLQNLSTKGLRLLQETDQNELEFLHQNFRDYFAAFHLSNEITAVVNRPRRQRESDLILGEQCYSEEILAYVSNISQEERAMPVMTEEGWHFPGKTCAEEPSIHSPAEKMLELYRDKQGEIPQNAVRNLLQIMREGRKNQMAWCDYSRLDLRKCSMNRCQFVLWHQDQIYPSCFDEAWMDRTFLLNRGHENTVKAICTDGADLLFSGDEDGIVWIYDLARNEWVRSIQRQNNPVVDLAWDGQTGTLAVLYASVAYGCALDGGPDRQIWINKHRDQKFRYVRFGTGGRLEVAYDLEPLIYYTKEGCRIAPEMEYDVTVGCARWHPQRMEYIRSYLYHMISSNVYNSQTGTWMQHEALQERKKILNQNRKENNLQPLEKCYLMLRDDDVPGGGSVQCLCYHPGGDRFLVSIQNQILEYDNRTMDLIRKKILPAKVHTVCYGKNNTIYAGSGSSIVILGQDMSVRLELPGVPKATISTVRTAPDGDGCYVLANRELKKLDSNLRVERIRTCKGSGRFEWCRDRKTNAYQMAFLPRPEYPNGFRYEFETDTVQNLGWCYEILPEFSILKARVYNMGDYVLTVDKQPPYHRTTFANYRGIWIFGCSFRMLRGDMAEKKNVQFLRQNGGIVDE